MDKQETMVVGYRYGRANGNSYNTRENHYENGVSMASVAGLPECRSFATMAAKEAKEKTYYIGMVSGQGGDDEYLLKNVVEISSKKYKAWLSDNKEITKIYVQNEIDSLSWAMEYAISNMQFPFESKIAEIKNSYIERKKVLLAV